MYIVRADYKKTWFKELLMNFFFEQKGNKEGSLRLWGWALKKPHLY